MHLAGDAASFGLAGQLGAALPLLVEPLGPGPEREDRLPPDPHDESPAQGDRRHHEAGKLLAQLGHRGRVQQRENGAAGDGQQCHRDQHAASPAHRGVEDGDQRGALVERGEHPGRGGHGHGHGRRARAPGPQREARR